ncbi:MAG TPA: 50S ribosomal protein L30 [Blastocatellia bacterium]|nr:50S ribosomal protein L30 [Blastocatellia bacterium]
MSKAEDKESPNQAGEQGGKIRIQWYRSTIGCNKGHKTLVRSLGLTKLNQTVERPDTPAIRGMVKKVPHLLRIVD